MKETKIQWSDSTVNPIMGCGGCELFPKPQQVLAALDERMSAMLPNRKPGSSRRIYRKLIFDAYDGMPEPNRVNLRSE